MKQVLEQLFSSYGELSKSDITNGLDFFTPKLYKKGDFLIKAQNTCNWIGFVSSGIVRNFYISSKGEEVTYCITFPNTFITAYSSFISGKKTFENIHAITDVEMLVIDKTQFSELTKESTNWLKFANHFAEQSYLLMENRLLALQMESAEKRYSDLLTTNPEFLQNVPLKYLASYLGITQRHLSRLRGAI
ncbi:Crp/Fnr family transcriptional regulator [Tenacibaculum sp. SG-28]|uniref:Crp/Fnr family transcriptional regulator n=1 Tax=Tenacibaculum sp. SG-28 TaxID=754426 RepID=UPI000CF57E26|nr:Crp/Fnr family transcriptional regulator [Tenacibaculum sp. SG-28]PQJ23419.1 cAMP-binding protein [Tenacibaculum sp. SG-28]